MSYNKIIMKSSYFSFFIAGTLLYASPIHTNTTVLKSMAEQMKKTAQIEKLEAVTFARQHNIPVREKFSDGSIIEIQKIQNNHPRYFTTHNANAAISTRTDKLWSAPFNTTGTGYTKLGEWDGGAVRTSHQELQGRVTQVDDNGSLDISDHSTHVAGTLIASGVNTQAKVWHTQEH